MVTAVLPLLRAFPPLVGAGARCLVLGSMPGAASLAAGEYYAHPRNLFWPLVGEVLGFATSLPYAERCAALVARGVAVWDVLAACEREGSLDADIRADSMVLNDFAAFFARHAGIRRVCFNGGTAARLFVRRVLPGLPMGAGLECVPLPSTSPAFAAMPRAEKLAHWRAGLLGNGI